MAVDIEQYMVDLKGKQFVTYQGLLALAHDKGLKKISTEVRQLPDAENGHLAVMHAMVEMEDGSIFMGIGDASKESVGRMIQPHLLRMSETRAKARALRDAVNVGITSLEELGPDDDSAPAPVTPLREAQQQSSDAAKGGPNPASVKQVNYLKALLADRGADAQEKLESKLGKKVYEFTSNEARKWIEKLAGKTG